MIPAFSMGIFDGVRNAANGAVDAVRNALGSGGGSGGGSSSGLFGNGIANMMIHLQQNLPALTSAIFGFCYLAGIWLSFRAIYKLKQYGELRTMMSSNTDLREPMLLFAAAALLMYLPTSIGWLENSFFSNYTATPISYQANVAGAQWGIIRGVVTNLIRIIGVIAIIKGILIMSGLSGGAGGGQNTLGKAVTFIIGGMFAANLNGLISVLENSLGVVVT